MEEGVEGGGRVCCSELLCVGAPRSALASRPVGRGHRSGGSSSAAAEGTGAGTAAERGRVALPCQGDPEDAVSISLSPAKAALGLSAGRFLPPSRGERGEGSVAASC